MSRLPLIPDPMAGLGLSLARPSLRQEIEEEERDSILSEIGSGALSGIGYVGGLLDKFTGSRALRGLLGGKPRELLSILPGSDTFGITDERDIVSGEDILGGELDPDNLDSRDVLGFGLEMLLDPTLPLSFGPRALSKAGQGVAKSGFLKAAIHGGKRLPHLQGLGPRQLRSAMTVGDVKEIFKGDDLLEPEIAKRLGGLDDAEKIGGSVGVGIPFGSPQTTFNLPRLDKGLDDLSKRIGDTAPARWMKELFDPTVDGTRFGIGQTAAREMTERTRLANAIRMERVGKAVGAFERAGVFAGEQGFENMDFVRKYLETPEGSLTKGARLEDMSEDMARLKPVMDEMKQHIEELRQDAIAAGIEAPKLEDFIDYFPRNRNILPGQDLSRRAHKSFWDTFNPTKIARGEHMKGAFTDVINRISMNPKYSGRAFYKTDGKLEPSELAQMWKDLRDDYDLTEEMFATGGQTVSLHEDGPLYKFLDSIANLDPRHAQDQIPLFRRDPLRDYHGYVESMTRSIEAAKGVRRLLGDNVKFADDVAENVQTRSLKEVMSEAGMNIRRKTNLHGIMDAIENNPTMMERIRQVQGENFQFNRENPEDLLNVVGARQLTEETSQLVIENDVIEQSLRFMAGHQDPKNLAPWVDMYDRFTQQMKTSLTAIWPSFHTRNAVSALFNNFVIGMGKGNPMQAMKALKDGVQIARGQTITGLESISDFAHLSDDVKRTQAIVEEMYATGTLSRHQSQMGETSAGLKDLSGQPQMVGNDNLAKEFKQGLRGMAKLQGPGKAWESLTGTAESASTFVETINRAAPYIDLRKQGFSPAEASAKVKAAQVDYRALTNTERNYMRRMLPFYTFTRRQIPFVLENLIHKPSGLMAQAIRGTGRAGEDDSTFVPEHIAQTAAIPIGMAKDGISQRYLTGLGLGHEDVMNLFRPRRTAMNTLGSTMAGIVGRMNPLLKAPLELASNRQFFSGRELSDLDSPVNRIRGNIQQMATGETPGPMPQPGLADFILSNSPVSRALTTLRTATDPRKGIGAKALNLGTGLRFSDVDPVKAEQIAMRQALTELVEGSAGIGKYESLYVRDPGQVSPREALMMQVYEQLKRDSARRARAREGQ